MRSEISDDGCDDLENSRASRGNVCTSMDTACTISMTGEVFWHLSVVPVIEGRNSSQIAQSGTQPHQSKSVLLSTSFINFNTVRLAASAVFASQILD
jgi:hypothetical protein